MRSWSFVIASALLAYPADAAPKLKKCSFDAKFAPAGKLVSTPLTDAGPVAAAYSPEAKAVSLSHWLDGTPIGAPIQIATVAEKGSVVASTRTSAGHVLILELQPPKPAAGATGAKKVPTMGGRKVSHLGRSKSRSTQPLPPVHVLVRVGVDAAGGSATELPPLPGAKIRHVVATKGGLVLVHDKGLRVLRDDLTVAADLGQARIINAVRLGREESTLVAVVIDGLDEGPDELRLLDTAPAAWTGRPTSLAAADRLIALEDAALVVGIAVSRRGAQLQASVIDARGKLGRWRVWHKVSRNHWMDESTLAVARAPTGEVFAQWAKQLSSGTGNDDTPHFYAAQIGPSGARGPLGASTTQSVQVAKAVATSDGVYLASWDGDLVRWTCK